MLSKRQCVKIGFYMVLLVLGVWVGLQAMGEWGPQGREGRFPSPMGLFVGEENQYGGGEGDEVWEEEEEEGKVEEGKTEEIEEVEGGQEEAEGSKDAGGESRIPTSCTIHLITPVLERHWDGEGAHDLLEFATQLKGIPNIHLIVVQYGGGAGAVDVLRRVLGEGRGNEEGAVAITHLLHPEVASSGESLDETLLRDMYPLLDFGMEGLRAEMVSHGKGSVSARPGVVLFGSVGATFQGALLQHIQKTYMNSLVGNKGPIHVGVFPVGYSRGYRCEYPITSITENGEMSDFHSPTRMVIFSMSIFGLAFSTELLWISSEGTGKTQPLASFTDIVKRESLFSVHDSRTEKAQQMHEGQLGNSFVSQMVSGIRYIFAYDNFRCKKRGVIFKNNPEKNYFF